MSILREFLTQIFEKYLFSKIAHSASQIQYDLDQVLNMYKLDEIKNDFHSEKVNLNSVCKDCINELKSSFITKGIFPKLAVTEELAVYSDSKWLRFVLYQLLTNKNLLYRERR